MKFERDRDRAGGAERTAASLVDFQLVSLIPLLLVDCVPSNYIQVAERGPCEAASGTPRDALRLRAECYIGGPSARHPVPRLLAFGQTDLC